MWNKCDILMMRTAVLEQLTRHLEFTLKYEGVRCYLLLITNCWSVFLQAVAYFSQPFQCNHWMNILKFPFQELPYPCAVLNNHVTLQTRKKAFFVKGIRPNKYAKKDAINALLPLAIKLYLNDDFKLFNFALCGNIKFERFANSDKWLTFPKRQVSKLIFHQF